MGDASLLLNLFPPESLPKIDKTADDTAIPEGSILLAIEWEGKNIPESEAEEKVTDVKVPPESCAPDLYVKTKESFALF